ncbi:MAG TPA: tripartite tricarboxylate transporter substrate binding protein [Burkholderiales bacterium]|nr:tripartite tricarboxylate transporter substrate binding protein [Burkholderiales bacterium]
MTIVSVAASVPAFAQQPYPTKPLKMIMSFPAGGPTDILGRLLGQKFTESWGQNVVIDNRPGGGGVIGAMLAVKSPPDGYTMYLGGITTLVLAPMLHKSLPYDPMRDFQPVSQTTLSPLLLMTHPSLPAKTVKDFVALAKARPGQINYASSGPGGSGHLAGELFKGMTGVDVVHVPYRGAPPALTDLMAGQVQSMFGTMLAAVPHVRNGKIRAIAVTGPKRSIAVPDVPTFAEAGMPGYDASSWNGISVPAGTPRAVVEKLGAEIVRIMKIPGVLDRLAADGTVPIGSSTEEFVAFIKAEQTKWGKVVRAANMKID